MTTVGYGDLSPQHLHSRWFCVFFILLSTIMFANMLDQCGQVFAERSAEKRKAAFLAMDLDIVKILEMDESGDGKVDKGEFLVFGLQIMGAIEEGDPDVARIMEAFDRYDKDGSGTLDENDIEELLKEEEATRLQRKKTADDRAAAKYESKRHHWRFGSSRKRPDETQKLANVAEMTPM